MAEEKDGAFVASLKRNFKQIREDRAEAIEEGAEMFYKRRVEDLELQIKRMERDRLNLLDFVPSSTTQIMKVDDFKAEEFVKKDIEIGLQMRELVIERDIAKERYEYLFRKGHAE